MTPTPHTPLDTAREVLTLAIIVLLLAFAWLEGYGTRAGFGTFSDLFREHVRFDPLGRPICLALGCWAVWHLLVQPMVRPPGQSWRDFVALSVGFLWAALEVRFGIGA